MKTGYEPLNTLKPVAEGLWLIDGPAVPIRRLPHSTRASVAQLSDGGLWVHAPTELTDALRLELSALGPVAHLVCPKNQDHACLDVWQTAYPQARVWHPQDVQDRPDWSTDIDLITLAGSRQVEEVVFFHKASATLIVSQLIMNIETEKLPAWMRPFIWLAGTDDPNGGMPPSLRRAFRDRDALADSIVEIIEWRPRRIILSHGRWYERDAVAELERAFRKVLRERLWMKAVDDMKARDR